MKCTANQRKEHSAEKYIR